MGLVAENLKLAEQLLSEALDDHRRNLSERKGTNYLSAKFAGEVALLYGFDTLLEGFRQVLKHAQLGFWMSIRHPRIARDPVRRAFTTIPSIEVASASYPYIGRVYFQQYPLDRYPNNDFRLAYRNANDGYEKESVLVTQVFHEQFAAALAKAPELSERDSGSLVRLVATIEAFRRRKFLLAKDLFTSLSACSLSDWTKVEIAIGICGRTPWIGYPYADD